MTREELIEVISNELAFEVKLSSSGSCSRDVFHW